MAGRRTPSRGLSLLRTLLLQPSSASAASISSFAHPPTPLPVFRLGCASFESGSPSFNSPSVFPRLYQRKWMSSDISELPQISDADVKKALSKLLAVNWLEIKDGTEDAVEAALSKTSDDRAGQEILKNAWRAAEAVEKFSGTLVSLRMAMDELNGFSGENVKELPEELKNALDAALHRYKKYLAAFEDHETYLKKKVEMELGSQLIHIRQRCSGLDPEWGSITLLGTSGLSGSYIERRAAS